MNKIVQRLEEIDQAKVVKWSHKRAVRELMPALRWLHHSPNGGKRSALTGAQMTALGTKKGWPDLVLPFAHAGITGLVIEMKHGSGKKTDEQREWMLMFESQGYRVRTCYTAEDARRVLCSYFGIDYDIAPPLVDA